MKHIYKKELAHYFNNPFGYILIVLATLIANILFVRDIYAVGLVSMRPFFQTMYWIMVLFIPALCMRTFAEERKTGTIETLLTSPIKEQDIVVGKLLSVLTMIGITFVLSFILPVSFAFIAGLYLPETIVGYIGLLLLAGMFSTLSMYISLKTTNQVVAFFVSAFILFCLSIFSADVLASYIPRTITDLLAPLIPLNQLESFIRGTVELRAVFYFLSFSGVFMYAVIKQLQHRD